MNTRNEIAAAAALLVNLFLRNRGGWVNGFTSTDVEKLSENLNTVW